MKLSVLLMCGMAALLTACSHDKAPAAAAATAPTPAQAPAPTVLDPQLRALQKAKGVQKTIDQQKADLDKKLDEQSG
jgi:hypothetical protein